VSPSATWYGLDKVQVWLPEFQVPPMPGQTLPPFAVLNSVVVLAKAVANPESASDIESEATKSNKTLGLKGDATHRFSLLKPREVENLPHESQILANRLLPHRS
jgi:hypothetical protein